MCSEPENPWGEPSEGFLKYLDTLTLIVTRGKDQDEGKHYKTPDGFCYDESILRGVYETKDFKAKPDDIFVMSFPKTGTTWVQEVVYLIATDCDFQGATSLELEERFPFLEWPTVGHHNLNPQLQRPRLIKTHVHYSMLSPSIKEIKPKIVYITRNPKDTMVSMYHFYYDIIGFGFDGTFEDFAEIFMQGNVTYAPYGKHVVEMWERRHDENILFITYERMQKDLRGAIEEIGTFLGKTLTDEQVEQIAHHCTFQQMASNKCSNYERWQKAGVYKSKEARFMRKGKSGGWKSYFSQELNQKVDGWIKETFKDCDIKFEYEI